LKFRLHHLTFFILLAGTSGVLAQEQLREVAGPIAPAEVVLYIQSDLKRTGFVQPLVCALQRVLTAPISVQAIDLPLGSELLATPTQFEVTKVADRFIQRTANEGKATSFKYLLVPFDLKVEAWNWRYAFSTSFGDKTTPYHVGVVSTARIRAGSWWLPSPWDQEITVSRAYKLILKSIAHISGHRGTGACLLATPLSLEELDRKSSEFCPDDRAALVAAGILKEKEQPSDPACTGAARRSLPELIVTARRILDEWWVTRRYPIYTASR
jgi:predicted Zn-dependent protease